MRSQALDPESIPGRRIGTFNNQNDILIMVAVSRICIMYTNVAQLRDRHTQDVKVIYNEKQSFLRN